MAATAADTQTQNPFIKQLASSNRRRRDEALDSLRTYLQRPTTFTDLELLKLWKGLFFCMWMSDKPLTQQRLARDLAELLHAVKGRENFLGLVKAFWITIAREWGGIDALRMDKFMYLVRCYLRCGFERVAQRQWADQELLRDYLDLLRAVPLNVSDPKIPDGLRLHVLDVYVDELDQVDRDRRVPLDRVMQPLRTLGEETRSKSVRARAKEALADQRLVDWEADGVDTDGLGAGSESDPSGSIDPADEEDEPDAEVEFDGFGD